MTVFRSPSPDGRFQTTSFTLTDLLGPTRLSLVSLHLASICIITQEHPVNLFLRLILVQGSCLLVDRPIGADVVVQDSITVH